MRLLLREILRAFILGTIIFLILALGVWNVKIKWSYDLLYSYLFVVFAYTMTLYAANSLVFIGMDRIFGKGRMTAKRLILGFVTSFIVSVTIILLLRIFEDVIIEGETFSEFIAGERLSNYYFAIIITLSVSILAHAFHFYKKYQENRIKQQKIIAGTASAKFETLKNQIDPHFLFNSLNVLSSLIEENPDNAQRFTTSLSKIYRYVLEQRDKELVSVEEELSFAKTYMNLLKMRFENSVFFELPEKVSSPDAKVVPLSLQLLLLLIRDLSILTSEYVFPINQSINTRNFPNKIDDCTFKETGK